MKNLPMDVISYILEYDGRFKYRNGVFMSQISKYDKRYTLLLTIPNKYYTVSFTNDSFTNNCFVFFKNKKFSISFLQNDPKYPKIPSFYIYNGHSQYGHTRFI